MGYGTTEIKGDPEMIREWWAHQRAERADAMAADASARAEAAHVRESERQGRASATRTAVAAIAGALVAVALHDYGVTLAAFSIGADTAATVASIAAEAGLTALGVVIAAALAVAVGRGKE